MLRSFIVFVFCLFTLSGIKGQALEHKPKQPFLSPFVSMGIPTIINQNNYGYSEPGYSLTFGWQTGVMVGWDYFLKQSYKTGIILSKWGQHYSDELDHYQTKKIVDNYYVQVPFSYKHVFGRKRGYDNEVFSPYVFGTAMIGYLFHSRVDFLVEQDNGEFQDMSLVDFVTRDEAWNENTEELLAQGNPEKDRYLFSPIDINLEIGGGYQFFITRRISLFAESQVAMGLGDLNAAKWRYKNNQNVYKSSHNLYVGIRIGANIYLFKNRR